MTRSRLARHLLGWLALAVAAPALGHDTWIAPRRSAIGRGDFARFDVTSGAAFPALDSAVAPDRLARAEIRVGGKRLRIAGRNLQKHSLVLTRAIDRAGIAAVWLELKPRSVELTGEQIKEYLAEIGAEETIGRQLAQAPAARWRELYRKHAKTFLRVGEVKATDRSWSQAVGMSLEIVPEDDPTSLYSGDRLTVRVLKDGRPLPDFALFSVAAARKERRLTRTDAEGRVRIVLDAAGQWLLAGTRLTPSTRPRTEWESDFTTLTLVVQPAAPASATGPSVTPISAPHPATLVPDPPFTGRPTPAAKPYLEILRLKEAGESDEALLEKIRSEEVLYSLTTAEIQKLRDAGVSQAVIEAMLRSGRGAVTPKPR